MSMKGTLMMNKGIKKMKRVNVASMVLAFGAMFCFNAIRAEEVNPPAATKAAGAAMAGRTALPPPKLTCKTLPVAKAKFHRYTNLRSGQIKTDRGWNVQDWAISLFNPNAKPIEVTWKLIADDPTFTYTKGSKGTWSKVFKLGPMKGCTDNVAGLTGKQFPIPPGTNWTGTTEFSSNEPFYVYILPHTPAVDGPNAVQACFKGWMLWADEVGMPWDEELKQFVAPYTNYWHNRSDWLGGWHSRLILINRSDKPVSYTLEHRPFYGNLTSFGNPKIKVIYQDDKAEICLNPGEKADLYLEEIFGWQKDFNTLMEGCLRVTPRPLEAREKTDVRLYILPDKVTVESLKEKEKQALSDEWGIVVDENAKK